MTDSDLVRRWNAYVMSRSTSKVFVNPSIERFTCSALAPLESTSHYLSQLNQLLRGDYHSKEPAIQGSIFIQTPAINEIGALARIHLAAFKEDRCVQLMYSDANHWQAITFMIEAWYRSTRSGLKQAVISGEGRVAGWLCCSIIGPDAEAQADPAPVSWVTMAGRVIESAQERLTKSSGMSEVIFLRDRRRKMLRVISNASTKAISQSLSMTSDIRYLLIDTLVVDPAYKGCGVGSELLEWIIESADVEEIAVWAQVTPPAYGLFETAGFEEVHSLVLDIDKGFLNRRKDDGKSIWGSYEFKYMMRKARDRSIAG